MSDQRPAVLVEDQDHPLVWLGGLDPDPRYEPEDEPRVPSPWERERQRLVTRPARPWGCVLAVLVSTLAWAVLLAIVFVVAAPRAAADSTSTAPRDLSGLHAAASGQPLLGAPLSATGGIPRPSAGGAGTVSAPAVITGPATWYDAPTARDAAAGPALRRALGRGWRDSTVQVCGKATCIEVVLSDWCACGHGHLIDLDDQAFRQLAPLSQGIVRVTVTTQWWARPTPPPTDYVP
jgi:hypothetical protein